jgi:hypothetical protein
MYGVTRMKGVCVALLQNIRIHEGWHKYACIFLKPVIVDTPKAKSILK